VAAQLAHCDHREPAWFAIGYALPDRQIHGAIDRAIGEVGQKPGNFFEPKLAAKITQRDGERESLPLAPELARKIL
jgi:hypothetical protein